MPKYKPEERTLTVGDLTIAYTWERKAVKNYNLRVRRDSSIHVSTPTRTTVAQLERFITDKIDFLRGALSRTAARRMEGVCALAEGEQIPIFGVPHTVRLQKASRISAKCEDGVLLLCLPHPEDAGARIRAFYRFAAEQVEMLTHTLTAKYAPYFLPEGAALPELALRRMKGRWGACFYTQNRICYNTNLIFVQEGCVHYVVCHELAHFRHHDHSAAFYAWLARVVPHHKEWRRVLHSTPLPQFEEN